MGPPSRNMKFAVSPLVLTHLSSSEQVLPGTGDSRGTAGCLRRPRGRSRPSSIRTYMHAYMHPCTHAHRYAGTHTYIAYIAYIAYNAYIAYIAYISNRGAGIRVGALPQEQQHLPGYLFRFLRFKLDPLGPKPNRFPPQQQQQQQQQHGHAYQGAARIRSGKRWHTMCGDVLRCDMLIQYRQMGLTPYHNV